MFEEEFQRCFKDVSSTEKYGMTSGIKHTIRTKEHYEIYLISHIKLKVELLSSSTTN